MAFRAEGVSFFTRGGPTYHKPVLRNISVECPVGQLMGILGPSGSGKTVFLQACSMMFGEMIDVSQAGKDGQDVAARVSKRSNFVTGKMSITKAMEGGIPISGLPGVGGPSTSTSETESIQTPSDFTQHCVYVPNLDVQFATLTCEQVLTYGARCVSSTGVEERVDSVIETLGLVSCRKTIVGGYVGMAGLSGGQRKRLAVGVGLLKNAKIMFMDEVTSGLDSSAAYNLMQVLKAVAKSQNVVMFCTLQQPAFEIWNNLLDRVLLVSNGRTVYTGPTRDCLHYFDNFLNVRLREGENKNPGDLVLDAINADFTSASSVAKKCEMWETVCGSLETGLASGKLRPPRPTSKIRSNQAANRAAALAARAKVRAGGTASPGLGQTQRRKSLGSVLAGVGMAESTEMAKLKAVLDRDIRVVTTDPMLYLGRCALFLVFNVFVSFVWYEGRDYDNAKGLNRLWPHGFNFAATVLVGVLPVYFSQRAQIIVRSETRNIGLYSAYYYALSTTLMAIPGCLIMAVCALMGGIYGIANYNTYAIHLQIIVLFLLFSVFEAAARCCALIGVKNVLFGMLCYMQFWFASFLFAGFFVNHKEVMWPIRAFAYISPHRYHFPLVFYLDFCGNSDCTGGPTWASAERCPPGGPITVENGCIYPGGAAIAAASGRMLQESLGTSSSYAVSGHSSNSMSYQESILSHDPLLHHHFIRNHMTVQEAVYRVPVFQEPLLQVGHAFSDPTRSLQSGNSTMAVGPVMTGLGEGFTCGAVGSYAHHCFGRTGWQVLNTLSKFYPTLDPEDNVLYYMSCMTGMWLFLSLVYIVGLSYALGDRCLQRKAKTKTSGAAARAGAGNRNSNMQVKITHYVEHVARNDYVGIETVVLSAGARIGEIPRQLWNEIMSDEPVAQIKQAIKEGDDEDGLDEGDLISPNTSLNPHISLVAKNIMVQVNQGKGKVKTLVNDVSLSYCGGQLAAILGPSGAGKTTLLNTMTFNTASNLQIAGCLELNGQRIRKLSDFQRTGCVYIAQFSTHFPVLTCRQNLKFTADFVAHNNGINPKEMEKEIDQILDLMGLSQCADTLVEGLPWQRGATLSDGQRKRLAVARALLIDPKILFLDEPTTGLDAASAFHCMKFLKKIAKQRGILVIATIHQPAVEIWRSFDIVTILSQGNIIYSGHPVLLGNFIGATHAITTEEGLEDQVIEEREIEWEIWKDGVDETTAVDFLSKELAEKDGSKSKKKKSSKDRGVNSQQTENAENAPQSAGYSTTANVRIGATVEVVSVDLPPELKKGGSPIGEEGVGSVESTGEQQLKGSGKGGKRLKRRSSRGVAKKKARNDEGKGVASLRSVESLQVQGSMNLDEPQKRKKSIGAAKKRSSGRNSGKGPGGSRKLSRRGKSQAKASSPSKPEGGQSLDDAEAEPAGDAGENASPGDDSTRKTEGGHKSSRKAAGDRNSQYESPRKGLDGQEGQHNSLPRKMRKRSDRSLPRNDQRSSREGRHNSEDGESGLKSITGRDQPAATDDGEALTNHVAQSQNKQVEQNNPVPYKVDVPQNNQSLDKPEQDKGSDEDRDEDSDGEFVNDLLDKAQAAFVERPQPAFYIPNEFRLPTNKNPADFILELVNADFSAQSTLDKVLKKWQDYSEKCLNAGKMARLDYDRTETRSTKKLSRFKAVCDALGMSPIDAKKLWESFHDLSKTPDDVFGTTTSASKAEGEKRDVPAIRSSRGLPCRMESLSAEDIDLMLLHDADGVAAGDEDDVVADRYANRTIPEHRRASKTKPRYTMNMGVLEGLISREFLVLMSDPSVFLFRFVLYWFATALFCIVYYHHRPFNQEDVVPKMFLLMWVSFANCVFALAAVVFYNGNYHIVRAEIRNGSYTIGQYLIAQTVTCLPFLLVLTICSTCGNGWGLGGFNWENYFPLIVIQMFLLLAAAEFFAHILSVLFNNILLGILVYTITWFVMFLFAGLMLDLDKTLLPFKIISYLFYGRYYFQNLLWIEFVRNPITIGKALECPPNSGNPACFHPDGLDKSGYTCGPPGTSEFLQCMGLTGEQALSSIKRMGYSIAKVDLGDEGVFTNTICLFCFLVVYKFIHVVVFYLKVSAAPKFQ